MNEIKKSEFYTPKDIASKNLTFGNNNSTRLQLILRAIRKGELKAKNVAGEKQPRYFVQGKDLQKYIDRNVKPWEYLKK